MPARAAALAVQIKMASVIVTLRIMPESPETDMKKLEEEVTKEAKAFGALSTKAEVKPFAYGLNALNFIFVINEAKGDTEQLEKKLADIEGVQGVEVTDVRRTIG